MSDLCLYSFLNRVEQLPSHNHMKSFNTTTKIYNNGTFKIQKNSWYTLTGTPPNPHNGSYTEQLKLDKTIDYLKTTKKKIFDLAYNNQDLFQYFITLTFDLPGSTYSHDIVLSKLTNWLDTQRKQNPNMYYLLVPELHKSGRLHFHGLFGNCPNWSFSSAINKKTKTDIYKIWFSSI